MSGVPFRLKPVNRHLLVVPHVAKNETTTGVCSLTILSQMKTGISRPLLSMSHLIVALSSSTLGSGTLIIRKLLLIGPWSRK